MFMLRVWLSFCFIDVFSQNHNNDKNTELVLSHRLPQFWNKQSTFATSYVIVVSFVIQILRQLASSCNIQHNQICYVIEGSNPHVILKSSCFHRIPIQKIAPSPSGLSPQISRPSPTSLLFFTILLLPKEGLC